MEGTPPKTPCGKPTFSGNEYGRGINVLSLDDSNLEKEGNALKIKGGGTIERFEKLEGKVEFCFKVISRKSNSNKEVDIELRGSPKDKDTFNQKVIPAIKVLQGSFGNELARQFKQELVVGQEYILETF